MNLIALLLLIKKVLPATIKQAVSIINITSDAEVNSYSDCSTLTYHTHLIKVDFPIQTRLLINPLTK